MYSSEYIETWHLAGTAFEVFQMLKSLFIKTVTETENLAPCLFLYIHLIMHFVAGFVLFFFSSL